MKHNMGKFSEIFSVTFAFFHFCWIKLYHQEIFRVLINSPGPSTSFLTLLKNVPLFSCEQLPKLCIWELLSKLEWTPKNYCCHNWSLEMPFGNRLILQKGKMARLENRNTLNIFKGYKVVVMSRNFKQCISLVFECVEPVLSKVNTLKIGRIYLVPSISCVQILSTKHKSHLCNSLST